MKRHELLGIMAAIIYANSAMDRDPKLAVAKAKTLLAEAEKTEKTKRRV